MSRFSWSDGSAALEAGGATVLAEGEGCAVVAGATD